MSPVLAVLWAASIGAGAKSPPEAKQWLHDAVLEGDELGVRNALSAGGSVLANTPDQRTHERLAF